MTTPPKTDPDRRRLITATAALGLGTALWRPAHAQPAAYPNRPVKFIVPFPPGSGTDTTARIFAKKIGEATGQGFIVDNKPGANGFIGVQQVLQAPPDGHTIFIGSNSTLSTNAATFKKLPYDPLTDFTPISLLSRGPALIIVPANSPYKTLADLIADAKKRPGALNFGSGSVSYLLYTEWINEIAKISTTHVPYKGAGDAVIATAGGAVDFSVVDSSGSLELVKGGKVRALAISDAARSKLLPDVPTAIEAGLPGYIAYNWVAAAVHAKTPPALAERIVALFKAAGQEPETKDFYGKTTTDLIVSTPEELHRYQLTEIERWKRLATVAKLELQ